jgi:hypothetical protein
MTVIAWDGRTLAADKRMLSGRTVGSTTKIFRIGAELVGFAGTPAGGQEMMRWYEDGAFKEKFPEKNRDPDRCITMVVIRKDGSIWEFQNSPDPFKHDDPFYAWGCGDEAALVAMACGKTAFEAVEMAARFNSGCGNGVDTLALKS